ncbi:hypothetical protein BGZ97_003375, partial [Linnemannia gamsii]
MKRVQGGTIETMVAAHNMTNIVLERLQKQQRPDCLQPINADGTYPWRASPEAGSGSTSS